MLPCRWFLYLFIIRMELCAASRSTEATPNELYAHAEKAPRHKSSASNNLPRLLKMEFGSNHCLTAVTNDMRCHFVSLLGRPAPSLT